MKVSFSVSSQSILLKKGRIKLLPTESGKSFFCTPLDDNKGFRHSVWAINYDNWMTEGYNRHDRNFFQQTNSHPQKTTNSIQLYYACPISQQSKRYPVPNTLAFRLHPILIGINILTR